MAVHRERLRERADRGGSYFAAPKAALAFIHTGCRMLDLALGGGWAEERIANIVGDKSTGKTLLCIEAAANFFLIFPEGMVHYREAEAAFDQAYAEALGMPLESVDFGPEGGFETIEDMFEDLEALCKRKNKEPILYIVDSLDALSDRGEMDRDIDQGSYGAEKAKKLSQLFRRLTRQMATGQITVIIVSQVRDKMNAMGFGRKTTRSGGRALDFYASQVLFLAQIKTLTRTVNGVERPTGIKIKAKCDKNKVSLPYREAQFDLHFGYGIDDALASLEWLKEVKALKDVDVAEKEITGLARSLMREPDPGFEKQLSRAVEKRWYAIEESFMPPRRKYS